MKNITNRGICVSQTIDSISGPASWAIEWSQDQDKYYFVIWEMLRAFTLRVNRQLSIMLPKKMRLTMPKSCANILRVINAPLLIWRIINEREVICKALGRHIKLYFRLWSFYDVSRSKRAITQSTMVCLTPTIYKNCGQFQASHEE